MATIQQRGRIEEIEQARVVRWSHKRDVRELMPVLRFLHHSPNGGKRDAFTGAQMKALGVKAGFPDLILPTRSQDPLLVSSANGLVIEMKSATGTLSTEQKDWKEHFIAENWQFRVARSAQEARSYLCQYLGIDHNCAPMLAD